MSRSIRVLLVEDSDNDALLLLRHLTKGGFAPESKAVDNADDMIAALKQQPWDVIISDYVVPGFGGLEALEVLKNHGLDLPFIIVSGQIGEDVAIKAMKAGAHDYVMKHNLTRLVPAVEREMREAEVRRERTRSLTALRESEERFRQLAENIEAVFILFEAPTDGSPGPICYVSPIYERLWGSSTKSLHLDRNAWLDAVHPEDSSRVRSALPALARGEFNLEFRLKRPDGMVRWVEFRAFPILNPAGQIHRMAAIADDITERKEVEQRLAAAAEALRQSNEELRTAEEELRASNAQLSQARDQLEMRVIQRTAALSKANAELHRQIEERRRLEKELLDITEQERQRLGIDLHDDLGQQLMGLSFMVKGLEQKLEEESPSRAAEAQRIHALVCKIIQHAHDLALDLTSELEGDSLPAALRKLAARVNSLFSVECHVESEGDCGPLPPAVAAHLYKIAQEALTNAVKHGKARRTTVRFIQDSEKILLSIWNDGVPFQPESSHNGRMGLRIMSYRAHVVGGSLEVTSDKKNGTKVVCLLPLMAESAAENSSVVTA